MWIKLVAPIMLSAVSNAEFPKSRKGINKCYWINVFIEKTPPQHYLTSHLFLQSVLFAPHNHQDLLKYQSNSKTLKKKVYVKVIPLCSIRSILNTSHRLLCNCILDVSHLSLPPPPEKKERWRVLCNSLKKDIKSKSKLWASLINVNELVMI